MRELTRKEICFLALFSDFSGSYFIILCELQGGSPALNIEVSDIAFHPIDNLPELDLRRASKEDILRAHEHYLNPQIPTYFN